MKAPNKTKYGYNEVGCSDTRWAEESLFFCADIRQRQRVAEGQRFVGLIISARVWEGNAEGKVQEHPLAARDQDKGTVFSN